MCDNTWLYLTVAATLGMAVAAVVIIYLDRRDARRFEDDVHELMIRHSTVTLDADGTRLGDAYSRLLNRYAGPADRDS